MSWLKYIAGIIKGGKNVAEAFTVNKEKGGEPEHEENIVDIGRDIVALKQFTAEFHSQQNLNRWDSFVDGLNRLPRPILAIAIIGFFVLAPVSPERFLLIAKAFKIMPAGYWALLSVIVGFYFGGRMQIKSQDITIKQNAVQAAKELVSKRKEFRQIDADDESVESKIFETVVKDGEAVLKNKVVERWLAGK
jgi:hypothetical protein